MCKYNTYAIEIVHINGNKQLREAKKNDSYKDTITLYHQIKEDYMTRDVTINFIGITEEDEQGIIFTKKNTIIEDEKRDVEDLIMTINEAAEQLQEQYKIISGKESYYDKRKSNIDHLFVEAVDADKLTDGEKIKIFDEIREINLMRRDYKILNTIRKNTCHDLNLIMQKSRAIYSEYDKHIQRNTEKLASLTKKENGSMDIHLIEEVKYKDFKHRMQLMKEYKKKFDKIIHFPEKKVIACYNKCYNKCS